MFFRSGGENVGLCLDVLVCGPVLTGRGISRFGPIRRGLLDTRFMWVARRCLSMGKLRGSDFPSFPVTALLISPPDGGLFFFQHLPPISRD